jgi:acyl carrier protein
MNEVDEVMQEIAQTFDLLNIEVPSEDTDLFQTGLVDSLTFVELLVHIEETMGITVTLEELEPDNFRSVRDIANFVVAHRPFAKCALDA